MTTDRPRSSTVADVADHGTDHHGAPELFQLDRATCLALLTTQYVGRLIVPGGEPQVLPVNYAVIDGAIAFRSDDGARAARLTGCALVFEVDMIDQRTRSGWSVVVRGSTRVASSDQRDRIADRIESWAPGPKDVTVIIGVDEVTGRLVRGAVPSGGDDDHGYL